LNQTDIERIDHYLMGRMSATERAQFERDMETNAQLAAAYRDVRDLQNAMAYEDVANSLRQIRSSGNQQAVRRTLPVRIIAVAASIAILMVVYFVIPDKSDAPSLYTEYFTPDPGLPTLMDVNQTEYAFYQGMVDYKAGNYAAAYERWHPLAQSGQYGDTLSFYLGMTQLGLKKTAEAKESLAKVTSEGPFGEKKSWYLALIAIEDKDLTTARRHLESLASGNGAYAARAQELVGKLGTEK
jgi:hypothetical protein